MRARRFNILVNCPNIKDATSLYRGIGPLSALQSAHPEIRLNYENKEFNWVTFVMSDLFFLQRGFTNEHVSQVMMAIENGCPVWVDYDDDLFSVPLSNPSYRVYSRQEIQKNIAKIISLANVVTVSTPHLKKRFELGPQPLNADIRVVPNAIAKLWVKRYQEPKGERDKMIVWRGSATHQKDLSCFLPEIKAAANADKTWTWVFQGDKPWFVFEALGENTVFGDPLDPIIYMLQMQAMKPPVMMVPLENNVFNRSKSNIAWLEAAFFGGMTLAPAWEEWDRPGVLAYTDAKDFADCIHSIQRGDYDPNREAKDAWAYIMDNLRLEVVNQARWSLVQEFSRWG